MNQTKQITVWIGILLLLFISATYGQDEAALWYGGPLNPEEGESRITGQLDSGVTFIEQKPFLRFQLQPNINLDKIGFGLDVVLLYDLAEDAKQRFFAEDGETWNDRNTILRVLRYVRYGHLKESFYSRFGVLNQVTMGNGFHHVELLEPRSSWLACKSD